MTLRLGLRENASQFTLLVVVNAFVGAMVGMERSILPAIAVEEFHLVARAAVLSFIVVFGISKALTNYAAGRLSDRFGRKHVLIAGWLVAVPVPFMLMWAPTWNAILAANVLLGVSQGLTWSTTVIMKIDLAGSSRRGLAMGLNECAGYLAVAVAAAATGWIAAHSRLRPEPFYLGVAFVAIGLVLSAVVVRETREHVQLESRQTSGQPILSAQTVFWRTSLTDPSLSSVSQAGLVNNLNDGMAWGLFPLATGALSDRIGRKWLIATGMWTQAAAIGLVAASGQFSGFAIGLVLLGIGTAMVYPTLLAAVGDVASPSWRASAVGVYRLWRDLGYALGALFAGVSADAFGLEGAIWSVAGLTLVSGVVAAVRMHETRPLAAAATS